MNKTLKKTLSIILTILMIVTSVPFAFAADETPPTRTIDGKTYYELDSADDLYWFAEQVNVNENDTINAILTADIVINENLMSKITVAEDGTATINEGETVREWTPIKYFINSDMVGYKGIFDGSNHTISGLYGNSDDMHYMGFFALANGATIKNLGIIDSYFYEYHNVASVVALARNTTIINCFSENCLIANESQRAGGIAGMLYNSNIIGCYNASTIRESGGGYYIGGIVGESVSTTISDCFNIGSIVATGDKVGGIVGCINSSSAVVENCYNIGKINSDSEKTGGIAGENWGSVIDCYFNSEIFSGSAIGNNEGSAVSSEGKTALQFASGEVAYAFGPAWGQKLGTDPYPVLGSTDTVYRVATYTKCDMSDVPVCEYNNTSGSDINNAPQHVLTGEITCMGELCEVCGKYYGDADESKHLLSWKTAKEATCAEPGLEIYDCEVCGNAPAMETVLCDSATYPESGHDYPSQANEEYAFSYPGATKLVITFSEDTETENNYDFIYIYDSTGTEYGKYSGTELAGVQIDLEGGSFKIKLTSDGSVNRYGFRLASVYATAPTAEYQREISALGHNWSNKDGICAKEDCGYECTHETYTNGKCDVCGYECTHESYTAGKCNACGYECPHEGQNGSCQVCGANLGKLVIDVTDKSYVDIGTGYEYYDEDGYIITGTNPDTYVYIYESADLTLKNAVFSQLIVQYASEGSVFDITLEGANEVVGFIGFMKEHLIFNGSEGATLKTPYIHTNGGKGTATVNGGNIILDTVTTKNIPTIDCGDFIINGGTVTASNNYYNVISGSVKLNGGTMNLISTAPENEVISDYITMDKGALLTVSSATGKIFYHYDTGILMADGLAENNAFFVRYDTTSDFVLVTDINAALEGKTYAEIKVDSHSHSLVDGVCDVCGYICLHKNITDGTCDECGKSGRFVTITMNDSYGDGWNGNAITIKELIDGEYKETATATFDNGESDICSIALSPEGVYSFEWTQGSYSDECSFTVTVDGETVYESSDASQLTHGQVLYTLCSHLGQTGATCVAKGVCEICGAEYEDVDENAHDWSNKDGICANGCGVTCAHDNYTDGICDNCEYACPHESTYRDITARPVQNADGTWGKGTISTICQVCTVVTATEEVERDHEGYAAFDAAVAELEALLNSGEVIDGPKNGYMNTLNNLKSSAYSTVYTEIESAVRSMTGTLEGIIATVESGVADGTMKKADFSYMASLLDEVKALIDNNPGNIVPSQSGYYNGPNGFYSSCVNNPNYTQASYDSAMKSYDYENQLKALIAGLKDGTMLKADYTVIDEAIAEIEEKLASENVTDEGKAGLEEIKTQLEAMRPNPITSKADVAELEKALSEYEAELDKGIEDGTLVKFSGERVFLELAEEAEKKIDEKYGENAFYDFANENRDSFYSLYDKYFFRAASLEGGTMAENAENIEYIKGMVDELFGMAENCIAGTHNYGEGVLTRPVYDAVLGSKDGYYTYTCTVCAKEKKEAVKGADYSAYDAVSEEINTLLQSDDLTPEAKQAIYSAANECGLLSNDLMESEQNIVDDLVAELEKIVADAEEKIASGEYVKIDGIKEYNKITDALDAELMENYSQEEFAALAEKAGDEINARLGEIIEKAEALTGSVAENKDALAEIESELSALYAEVKNCLDGVHNGFVYEVTEEAKCDMNAIESATCTLCGETDEREVEGSALEHSFTKYEETEAPKCGVAGKEVAYCDNGCQTTDEKEIPALEHIFLDYVSNGDATCTADGTKTASCIHGCGATDTVADEGSMIDHSDEDGDKLCDDCGEEVYDRCDICGGKAHGDDKIQLVFCLIITIIRFVTSILKSIN